MQQLLKAVVDWSRGTAGSLKGDNFVMPDGTLASQYLEAGGYMVLLHC